MSMYNFKIACHGLRNIASLAESNLALPGTPDPLGGLK